MPETARLRRVVLLLAALAFLTGCSGGRTGGGDDRPQPEIVVIGVDGLEWQILLPMLKGGELPHLASLMKRGVYGRLETFEPTLSPVIWTSIATGKTKEEHGITDFTFTGDDGNERLYTSHHRRMRALWNIASERQRSVNVIGWWNTWPAEEVNGVMVSQFSSLDQGKTVWKGTIHDDWPGQTHPPEIIDEVLPLAQKARENIDAVAAGVFGKIDMELPALEQRLLSDSRWALQADETYTAVTEHLLRTHPASVTFTYLGLADVAGHRFFRHYQPTAYQHPPSPDAVAALGEVIPDAYRHVDELVERMVAAAGKDASFLLISDHGMAPVNVTKDFAAAFADEENERYRVASVNSGHHLRAEPGVLIAAGPLFSQGLGDAFAQDWFQMEDVRRVGSVYQITPTLLHLLGLPVARDMQGGVLVHLLAEGPRQRPVEMVESFESDSPWSERQRKPPRGVDEERLRQLRGLGYVQ